MLSNHDLMKALSHVRWIGGAPDAGKSTLATLIGEQFNLQVYSFDEHAEDIWENHVSQDPSAFAHEWMQLSVDERFIQQSPETQVQNILRIERESFPHFVSDILELPVEPPIIVEGNIVPSLLESILPSKQHAIWLTPSASFKLASFNGRGKNKWHNERSDPKKALANHLTRDALFEQHVKNQAEAGNFKLLEIDGSLTVDEVVQIVARHFELIADNPE